MDKPFNQMMEILRMMDGICPVKCSCIIFQEDVCLVLEWRWLMPSKHRGRDVMFYREHISPIEAAYAAYDIEQRIEHAGAAIRQSIKERG